jgi:hypothetical protein
LRERAFKGDLLLRTGKIEDARRILADLRQSLKGREDADGQYVRRYAQHLLAMLRIDPYQMVYEAREAAKIDCSPSLRRVLWMPAYDEEDPFDAEFETWMKANCPEEDNA